MRRLYFAGLLLFAAVSLQAQTLDGAILAAENNYYGTARTMALGNAVSALGGDLGSIGINPAGSAVANYSQVTFSPGFTNSRIGPGASAWAITIRIMAMPLQMDIVVSRFMVYNKKVSR